MINPLAAFTGVVLVVLAIESAGAQASRLSSDEIKLDAERISPHRLELHEIDDPNGDARTASWTYVTVDHIQNWDRRDLFVNWQTLTWNGSGVDMNWVEEDTGAIKGRVTPAWVPLGYLIESHHYGDVRTLAWANPDTQVHHFEDKPLADPDVGNIITWPYVLASLDLNEGDAFTLPEYSPYSDSQSYAGFRSTSMTKITDLSGEARDARVVLYARFQTEEEAADWDPDTHIGNWSRIFVSDAAPYFLGRETLNRSEDGIVKTITAWQLERWQELLVSPTDHVDDILAERARRLEESPQEIPWHDPNPTSRAEYPGKLPGVD